MKLATIRTAAGTRSVRVDTTAAVETGHEDAGALLSDPNWRELAETADGPAHPVAGLDFAPVVPRPEKIICVGLNYRPHILEMGRDLPTHPTLFAKYARALVGASDRVTLPASSSQMDWEAELAVIIGKQVRHASPETARNVAVARSQMVERSTHRPWTARTGS